MSSEARLQRLEDIESIRRLLTDYGRDLDRRDFKAYSELFAADGVWDGGFGAAKGPAEIQAMMEKSIGGEPIADADDVHAQLGAGTVGQRLTIDVVRGGAPRRLEIVVGERPE